MPLSRTIVALAASALLSAALAEAQSGCVEGGCCPGIDGIAMVLDPGYIVGATGSHEPEPDLAHADYCGEATDPTVDYTGGRDLWLGTHSGGCPAPYECGPCPLLDFVGGCPDESHLNQDGLAVIGLVVSGGKPVVTFRITYHAVENGPLPITAARLYFRIRHPGHPVGDLEQWPSPPTGHEDVPRQLNFGRNYVIQLTYEHPADCEEDSYTIGETENYYFRADNCPPPLGPRWQLNRFAQGLPLPGC